MSDTHLHIVSFNVPWPANYGGVIDVYYRVKALHDAGVRVHLHCYTYGRPQAKELEQWCDEVFYYRRDTKPWNLLGRRPYITSSRHSRSLFRQLMRDDHPVLLEGLHSAFTLEQIRAYEKARGLKPRTILLRAHNVEHDYYSQLAKVEPRMTKRLYLRMEARKLLRYEPVMREATHVLAVTQADANHFSEIGCKSVVLLPSSHPFDNVVAVPGKGGYAIYQGNLSVGENIEAARYLITEVFSRSHHRLILAGCNPSGDLIDLAGRYPNISLVANPSDEEMDSLIANAQVNVLYTKQPTGLKLKLLHALYCGRYCLVNPEMVAGTSLETLCHVADNPQAMMSQLDMLMDRPFSDEDLRFRSLHIGTLYSPSENARILKGLL